ncbi:MAG: bifunctional adenosylcobinamide kinase/adenosylcobinamide-phosphate guanylyltransferase [Pseudomonadota bacterium]
MRHAPSHRATRTEHTLVLGGARSGKTRHALALAEAFPRRTYLATAEAFDDEMAERIAAHKAERGEGWVTLEAPLALDEAIAAINSDGTSDVIAIDCLTIWLSNAMHREADIDAVTERLLAAVSRSRLPIVMVSNEVGLSIVPENALARRFRDAQGRLNQRVAAVADRVTFVAAGLPLSLKAPAETRGG